MEKLLDVGDTSLKIEIIGEGEPLLFVHGGPGGNYLSFRKVMDKLGNYKLVFYDQRGTGESERFENPQPENFSMDKHLRDIEAIRKYLKEEKIILLGHSWGGSLVTFYANAYPERIKKLIIYSGGPETSEMADLKNDNMMSRLSAEAVTKINLLKVKLGELIENESDQDEIDQIFGDLIQVIAPALEKDVTNSSRKLNGRFGFWAANLTNLYMNEFKRDEFLKGLSKVMAPVLITYGEHEPSPIKRFIDLAIPPNN